MKYLLNGTAIAAALVIAAPVWAQTSAPVSPSTPSASTDAPMKTHKIIRPHRTHTGQQKVSRRGASRRGTGANDNIANQLNAQEAARNSGGGMGGAPAPAYGGGMGRAPAPAYGGPRNVYGQPNQTYGIPGAGQPSAAGPLPGAR